MVFQSLGRIQVIGRATTENLYWLRSSMGWHTCVFVRSSGLLLTYSLFETTVDGTNPTPGMYKSL